MTTMTTATAAASIAAYLRAGDAASGAAGDSAGGRPDGNAAAARGTAATSSASAVCMVDTSEGPASSVRAPLAAIFAVRIFKVSRPSSASSVGSADDGALDSLVSARRAAGSWHRAHRRADAWRLAADEAAGDIVALRNAFVVMKVAVQAGIADHDRAQENDEFALAVGVVPVLEQIAEPGNAPDERNFIARFIDDVLHQAAHHGDIAASYAQQGFDFTGLNFRNLADHVGLGQCRIGIIDVIQDAGNCRPHIHADHAGFVDRGRDAH